MRKKIKKEIKHFIENHKLNGFIPSLLTATAATTFVKSLIDGLIMPTINLFIPNGTWQTAAFEFLKVKIAWGLILSALLNLVFICIVAYFFMKVEYKFHKN